MQDGCTALYLASMKGHVKVVELLLKRNADVNICDKVRYSFYHQAVQCSCVCFTNYDHVQWHFSSGQGMLCIVAVYLYAGPLSPSPISKLYTP